MIRTRKIKKRQAGYTLVELVVTFAVISIFMAATIVVMGGALRNYSRMNYFIKAQSVADTLMQTMVSEISAAADTTVEGEYACVIEGGPSGTERIKYVDYNGYTVELGVNAEQILEIDYDDKEATQWYYGKESYMSNRITGLTFTPAKDNLIVIDLKLENKKTGYEFELKRVAKCYNLSEKLVKKQTR